MKKGLCIFSIALSFVFIIAITNHVAAYTINDFAPSAYNPSDFAAMEANLGITGAVIEDFNDLNLISGLSLSGPLYCSTGGDQ